MHSFADRLFSLLPDRFRNSAVLGQLAGFILVGGTGAVAFVVLSTLLIGLHTGLPDWVASALTWAALIVPVYMGHHRISFRASRVAHRQGLPRYVAVQISALILAALFSYIAYSIAHLPALYGAIIVTGLTSAVNFVVLKVWAFASTQPTQA